MYSQFIQSIVRIGYLPLIILLLPLYAGAQDIESLKSAKPFTINGGIGLSSVFYGVNGIDNRQAPFSYGLNADLNMSVYGVFSLPISFVWYSQQSSALNYPTFNRFGMSPKYKWFTAHFGYRNMRLSEFTLNGHTFLGAGVEMTPGKFRMAAMYGKFNQNSDNDPYMADSIPRFTRKGWAAKIGYGTERNFIDVSMLRIGDEKKDDNPPYFPGAPTPAENLALGVTTMLNFTPKLSFSFDGSVSCLTQNAADSAEVKIKGFGTSLVSKIITLNMTTVPSTAFKTSLAYKITDKIGTSVEYRRIDPEYQSLGAYFFSNDIEIYTFNANAGFWNNRIMLRGSFGSQRDNLGKTKKFTSKRGVGSLSGSINFTQNFGIDGNWNNLSTNQRGGRTAIIDSLKLFQVNNTFSITPRFTIVNTRHSHFVMFNYNRMKLDDKNKTTAAQTETATTILTANYSLGLLKSGANLSLGLNHTTIENNMYEGKTYGGSLTAAQALLKNKLSLSWANSYMLNRFGGSDGATFNSFLSANFRPHPKHSFNLGVNFISNSYSKSETSPASYNETRGDIRYAFTF